MAEEKLIRRPIIDSYSRRELIIDSMLTGADLEQHVVSMLHLKVLLRLAGLDEEHPEGHTVSLHTSTYSTTDDVIFVVTILHERAWGPYVDENENP